MLLVWRTYFSTSREGHGRRKKMCDSLDLPRRFDSIT